jgi:hypothetical protein
MKLKTPDRQTIIKSVLVFLIAYFVSLLIWIEVKDYYGYTVTFMSSRVIGVIKEAKIDEMVKMKDVVRATFYSPLSTRPDMLVDINVRTSQYTFNVPLTLGIMSSMYFFIGRRLRAFSEALLLLICIHHLFVMSLEYKVLTESFMQIHVEPFSRPRLFLSQFLWSFTDNMVIRFEPFLVGFYLFIRFRRQVDD